ncbi:MAG TPA: hypothetical protein VFR24_15335 [Candidatus Angelobacter sp.]|nr:hypothetical protein [Candidatus Angelobacter sp.]
MPRRQMLHHHNAAGEGARQGTQNMRKRIQSAGGRTHGHNIKVAQ